MNLALDTITAAMILVLNHPMYAPPYTDPTLEPKPTPTTQPEQFPHILTAITKQ